jgi:hypothetical protein
MKKSIVRRFENLEMHHRILFFAVVLIATILITRFVIYYVVDPDLKIGSFELHHFDYGFILLVIVSLLLLFGKKHTAIYLPLMAISLGLIIDELWFIRKQIGGNNPSIYNPSFFYIVLIALVVVLISLIILKFSEK